MHRRSMRDGSGRQRNRTGMSKNCSRSASNAVCTLRRIAQPPSTRLTHSKQNRIMRDSWRLWCDVATFGRCYRSASGAARRAVPGKPRTSFSRFNPPSAFEPAESVMTVCIMGERPARRQRYSRGCERGWRGGDERCGSRSVVNSVLICPISLICPIGPRGPMGRMGRYQ